MRGVEPDVVAHLVVIRPKVPSRTGCFVFAWRDGQGSELMKIVDGAEEIKGFLGEIGD